MLSEEELLEEAESEVLSEEELLEEAESEVLSEEELLEEEDEEELEEDAIDVLAGDSAPLLHPTNEKQISKLAR